MNIFAHMVLVAESRHLRMSDVLSRPLGPLPWTLANADGTTRKTNKAALARELEKHVLPAEQIHEPSVTITDGINLVQKMKGNDQTFSQVADSAMIHTIHEGVRSHRIDVVFDKYLEESIKTRRDRTGEHYRNTVQKHSARLPDPVMEKVSQQLGQ